MKPKYDEIAMTLDGTEAMCLVNQWSYDAFGEATHLKATVTQEDVDRAVTEADQVQEQEVQAPHGATSDSAHDQHEEEVSAHPGATSDDVVDSRVEEVSAPSSATSDPVPEQRWLIDSIGRKNPADDLGTRL